VSIFERGEHLRQGTALHPVPFARKVVLPLVSASIACLQIMRSSSADGLGGRGLSCWHIFCLLVWIDGLVDRGVTAVGT
jgi:hypothetical protein